MCHASIWGLLRIATKLPGLVQSPIGEHLLVVRRGRLETSSSETLCEQIRDFQTKVSEKVVYRKDMVTIMCEDGFVSDRRLAKAPNAQVIVH